MTNPDPPFNLVEDTTKKTLSTVGLAWTAPLFTGGGQITFVVSMSKSGSNFTVVKTNVTNTNIVI